MRAASSLACRQVVALARYHKWAHALLWETVSALPEEALICDLRLPFQSLAATYNHMLAGTACGTLDSRASQRLLD